MPVHVYSVEEVNALDYESFLEHFGGIVEHSSIVVAGLWSHQPFRDFAHLHEKLCDIIRELPVEGTVVNNKVNNPCTVDFKGS